MSVSSSNRLLGDDNEQIEYGTLTQPGNISGDIFDDAKRREEIENALLRKLDLRTAFLVLVYTMNYVGEALNPYLWIVKLNHIPSKMDRNNVA